jgi:hypothetical protein
MTTTAEIIELHQGTITFKVRGLYGSGPGNTMTIDFDGKRYSMPIEKVYTGEPFEVSFSTNTGRSHGEKLLRREAGDKAYGNYDQ